MTYLGHDYSLFFLPSFLSFVLSFFSTFTARLSFWEILHWMMSFFIIMIPPTTDFYSFRRPAVHSKHVTIGFGLNLAHFTPLTNSLFGFCACVCWIGGDLVT